MSNLVKSTVKEAQPRRKLIELHSDSDEELQIELEKAVRQYRQNHKNENPAPVSNSSGEKPKCGTDEFNENPRENYLNKSNRNCEEKPCENLNALTDLQDLIKYFVLPKKTPNKKTYSNYEKQGAIPKRIVRDDSNRIRKEISNTAHNSKAGEGNFSQSLDDSHKKSKSIKCKSKKSNSPETAKTGFNYHLSGHNGIKTSPTGKLCAKPFFYVVPENPSPTFFLPCGSYYVVPKTLDFFSQETIIIHPESLTDTIEHMRDAELISHVENREKARDTDIHLAKRLPRSLNNLGKEVPRQKDSNLNIGPMQARENYSFENLESNCNFSKVFDKTVLVPDGSSKTVSTPHEIDRNRQRLKRDIKSKKTLVKNTKSFPITTEECDDEIFVPNEDLEKKRRVQQRLMSEFPDMDLSSAEEFATCYYMDEESIEGFIASRHLSKKIEKQFNRLIQALPESSISDLREKSEEFEGDEIKELAYVEEVKHRNKCQQLATDMQCIFPDADPNFLREKIEEVTDDPDAINVLTDELLVSQNYPKISGSDCAIRKKLWATYVENFSVKNYILRVPNPVNFEGPAGDDNKADEQLIIRFLKTRYPDATLPYLTDIFTSHQRNITRTCSNIFGFRIVRLSESNFEHENFDENFLKEICYIDHKNEINNHLKTMKEMKEIEMITARLDGLFLYCPLCFDEELIASEAVTCPEGHVFCKECIKRYIEVKISYAIYKFACPSADCKTFFTISTVEALMPDIISTVVIKKQQAEEVSLAKVDGLEFCPQCDFAYIPNPEDRIFKCLNSSCLTETCRKCREKSHIPFRCEEIERPVDLEARKKIEETMTEKLIRRCPACSKPFVKTDGCNKISCTCGKFICYLCRKIINGYDHFKGQSSGGCCPLYSNNEDLHVQEVIRAGVQIRDQVLGENPALRIFYDPTT